jgi:dTDP-4-dehydrorhamnose 3,5-epimerase-like enzyme
MMREFKDERGSLVIYPCDNWNQVNISKNKDKYTFRGMHYQENPRQTKIIKVLQGSIIDFLYNLDTEEVEMYHLDENSDELYIPSNYAHGFITKQDDTIVSYLVDGNYNPSEEHSIPWYKITVIKNEVEQLTFDSRVIVSDKDKLGK